MTNREAALEVEDQEWGRDFQARVAVLINQVDALLVAAEAAEEQKLEEKRQELKPKTVTTRIQGCEVKFVTKTDGSVEWVAKDYELESPTFAKGTVKLAKGIDPEKEAEKQARKAVKRYIGE